MYTLAMAKNDFKEGWIDGFTLVRKDSKSGSHGTMLTEITEWMLEVSQGDAPAIRRCISAARGEVRMFKTIDSAIKTAEQIGFSVHALKFEAI